MNNYFPEKINGPLLTHEEIIRNWALFGDGWQLFYMGDPPPHGIYPIEPVSGWWVAVHTDGDWEVQYPVSTDAVRLSEKDRTPAGQSPLRVRVSALTGIRDRTQPQSVRLETGQDRTKEGQDTQDTVRPELALTKEQIISLYEGRIADKQQVIEAQVSHIETLKQELQKLSSLTETPLQSRENAPPNREGSTEPAEHTRRSWWQFWKGK